MSIVQFELHEAHRKNIARYKRLLKTQLTEHERDYIESRVSEEEAAILRLDLTRPSRPDEQHTSGVLTVPCADPSTYDGPASKPSCALR